MRYKFGGAITLLCALVTSSSGAQDATCPVGVPVRAEFGIRYRFTAGDFMRQEGDVRWVHFLTEPVVTAVDPAGPANGTLEVGDVIVAIDGALITTREGSRRFFTAGEQPVEMRVRRNGRPVRVHVRPRVVCSGR